MQVSRRATAPRLLLLAAACVLASCGAPRPRKLYEGARPPRDQVATLTASTFNVLTGESIGTLYGRFVIITPAPDGKNRIFFAQPGERYPEHDEHTKRKGASVTVAAVAGVLNVLEFDGARLQPAAASGKHRPLELELLPGAHKLGLYVAFGGMAEAATPAGRYRITGRTHDVILPVRAEAGHAYEIKAKALGCLERWRLWVEDVTARTPVEGSAVEAKRKGD